MRCVNRVLLKEETLLFAKNIGIDLIGITTAEPILELRPLLEERKAKGHLSGFEEKDLELRINPLKTMENAKTIIVIGQTYHIDISKIKSPAPELYGLLAKTAWGRDYHLVLKEKLQQLAEFLSSKNKDFQYKAYVDTGPLVERHLAYKAGLGWYGYNNCLINKDYGSWFFIGYMLINIELMPDSPVEDKCKGCRRCIEHCPGRALDEKYVFDAQRCISYLLQKKGELSEEERRKLGNRIYGCDECQLVCPHNKSVKESTANYFIPTEPSHLVDLKLLLNMSNKTFKKFFSTNASGWRGKNILQRNAIIALGNLGDKRAIPILEPFLEDPREDIREYAKWTLKKLND